MLLVKTDIFKRKTSAITLVEIVIASALFALLMLAAYRLFFSEIRSIRTALAHIGVNENARKFFAYLGNDIRNANFVIFPEQTNVEVVKALLPIDEGKLCVLKHQVYDFKIKPPGAGYLKEETITYFLRKAKDGTSDLIRKIDSPFSVRGGRRNFEKKICGGIKSVLLYLTNRKPVNISKFAVKVPFKALIAHTDYNLNGQGPYLVHVKAVFIRKGRKHKKDAGAHVLQTCFCVRGRLNGVNP